MAKQTGLGWTALTLDDAAAAAQDIRNDVTSLEYATPRAVQEVTGVDKSAMERLLGLADFTCDLEGVFNTAANMSHAVLKTASSTSVTRTLTLTIGGQTLANEVLVTDYQISRSDSGELTWKAPLVLADGTVPTWT
jgi:hypothetical protein